MNATRTRKGSRKARKTSPDTEARRAEVELAVQHIDGEAPGYLAFRARWGDRYSEANLARLWVQCPAATALHKFPTWRGTFGRQVRKGEHAIMLRQPHTTHDESKITALNPTGEVFLGAPWMSLFDISQTSELGDFDESAAPDADPDQVAEVKRLRAEAIRLHPDTTGDPGTAPAFMAAWARYEQAKAQL